MKHYFKKAAVKIYEDAKGEGRLIEGLTLDRFKEIAVRQDGVIRTQMGSVAADSEPMSRSAPHTTNNIDHPFGEEEEQLALEAVENLSRVSHGCIRLYSEDIASLFPLVPVGTLVRIIYEPIKVGWAEGKCWLQVYQDYENKIDDPLAVAFSGISACEQAHRPH